MIRWVVSALFAIAAILLGAIAFYRCNLPYNEEGRYFDTASSIVYEQQAVMVYAMLSLLAVVVAGAVLLVGRQKQ